VGACNSRERKYKNQDAANIANTILKMAKKACSDRCHTFRYPCFRLVTQDLEDMDLDRDATQRYDYVQGAVAQRRQRSQQWQWCGQWLTPARSNRSEYSNGNGVPSDVQWMKQTAAMVSTAKRAAAATS
jgi:hypothetical protein